MKRLHFIRSFSWFLLLFLVFSVITATASPLFTSSFRLHPSSFLVRLHPSAFQYQEQPQRKISPEALKKYVGRYQLEAGIIPISTLDVTLETDTLWIKPSVVKKRKLIYRSRGVFIDEIEGTPYTFNQGEAGKIVGVTFVYEGEQYTAQRTVVPAPSLKGNTTFRLKGYADAGIVVLAGSFNNWNQTQFIFGRDGGEWVCRIDLEPGKHAYKFIVDGNWLLDPANPNTEDDDYGVKNNVILVTRDAPQPMGRVP